MYQNWKLFGLLSPIDPNRYSAHFSLTQSIHFLLVTIFNFYKILMSKIFFLLCNVQTKICRMITMYFLCSRVDRENSR